MVPGQTLGTLVPGYDHCRQDGQVQQLQKYLTTVSAGHAGAAIDFAAKDELPPPATSTVAHFHYFPLLPAELRLRIW